MPVTYEKVHTVIDQRGFIVELLAASDFSFQRNAHIVLSFPGVVRGNHYHSKGRETVTVLGPALVLYRDNNEIFEIKIPEKEAWRFVFPPGVSHAIRNLSEEPNILIAFNTVEHNPVDPDTMIDKLID